MCVDASASAHATSPQDTHVCAPRESPDNMTNCRLCCLVWWVNKTSIGLLMFALDADRQQRQHWQPPAESPQPSHISIGNACAQVAPQADGHLGPCSLGLSRLRLMWNYCFNALCQMSSVLLLFFFFYSLVLFLYFFLLGNICKQIAGFFAHSNCHCSKKLLPREGAAWALTEI